MRYLFTFTILAVMSYQTANADMLTPSSVSFGVDSNTDPAASSCDLVVTILNYPASPEIANFRAKVLTKNGSHSAIIGFTLDVANMKYENGVPTHLDKTPLARASFASPTMNTSGRFYDTDVGGGGAGASTMDAATGSQFILAVTSGDFDISFSAKSPPEERTYHVTSAPPLAVINKFRDCVRGIS